MRVELNLVEPFLALGEFPNRQRIRWFDEPEFGGRQRAGVLGSDKEWRQSYLQRLT
jgi:hypothetical protein